MFITKTTTAMENQDKIYQQYKDAAGKAEQKGFDRMEAVWNRVEEKLDEKKKHRGIIYWKYTGVAALLLVFLGLGSLFFRDQNNPVNLPIPAPDTQVVTIDTNKVKEAVSPKEINTIKQDAVVVHEEQATEKQAIAGDSIVFNTLAKKAVVTGYTTKSGRHIVYETKHKELEVEERNDNISAEPTGDINFGSNISNGVYNTASSLTDVAVAKDKYAAQNKAFLKPNVITGIVSDETGPLPGATVFVKGKATVSQTDIDGKFSIEALEGEQLEISFVGFNSETIKVSDANDVGKIMLSGVYTLSEVVVDHYATKKQSRKEKRAKGDQLANFKSNTVTSAPRTYRDSNKNNTYTTKEYANIESVEDRANANIVQSLQGQVAGLNIATGSGQPGAESTVILRGVGTINGNAEPLFVIDGVPVDEDAFRRINQNDIADFKILKDAAATSIFGNRGANGVIVITTKGGRVNREHQLSEAEKRNILNSIDTAPGLKDPVYVVDGIAMDKESFLKLNPNDIASIDILKETPATALYGTRGYNGAIVIKTKQYFTYETEQSPAEVATPKIRVDQEDYEMFEENKFENTAAMPVSTFSIDVDNASYTNIRRFLNNGQTVPKDAVRIEEMINFFKYDYPQPKDKDAFSINTEYSDAPWNPNHKLLKIGLKGKDIPSDNLPASNFVFLIDVSGSMDSENKLPLLKQSMKLLVNQMRSEDRIAIVVYAGAAGLVLPSTSGTEKEKIFAALDNLNAGGSTAGGAGIELAYKTAQENFIKKGNNRVILATDGDFNVGASSDRDMQTLIEEKRQSGVFLTCLGYGMGNYKDSKMEILADKGNGNYAYIDNMQEADRFLQKEFKGSMYAIAKDVKIQIEFNPKHVQSYRLIGYENRKLRNEDFTNDAIDAGELGSGHTVTALYEIIPTGVHSSFYIPEADLKYTQPNTANSNYNDELATIKFRSKKPDEDKSTEIVKVIPNAVLNLGQTSGDYKFAAAVAWFGLKLRDSKLVTDKNTKHILQLAKEGLQNDPEGYRAEFIRLVNMVQ